MNNTVLWILIVAAIAILAVLIYNNYQEKEYRRKIHEQFGHSDRDALLEKSAQQVRDGQRLVKPKPTEKKVEPVKEKITPDIPSFTLDDKQSLNVEVDLSDDEVSISNIEEEDKDAPKPQESIVVNDVADAKESEVSNSYDDKSKSDETENSILSGKPQQSNEYKFVNITQPQLDSTKPESTRNLLISLDDLKNAKLSWFNHDFDYMAYVSLRQPKELSALPRLSSGRHLYRIIGCTMDGQFQPADPIPGVQYQAFAIGLQAISRSGLASSYELGQFGEKVNEFAKNMNGGLYLTDVDKFLTNARPLDALCAKVDQTIAIHLVSRSTITGTIMRSTLELNGFELSHDGSFYYPNSDEALFTVVDLENRPFTAELLAAQNYKGFSILFDITNVPPENKKNKNNFNNFMELTVKLSGALGLDLVDDKLNELSPQWLRGIGEYIDERQKEMLSVGIVPGGELAKRLFS
ncbi:MAG: cell division protein ZipA [Neisseriaceae bacterium]|nr:cell division protein ZipA [Neisseriaceae bacterium]